MAAANLVKKAEEILGREDAFLCFFFCIYYHSKRELASLQEGNKAYVQLTTLFLGPSYICFKKLFYKQENYE